MTRRQLLASTALFAQEADIFTAAARGDAKRVNALLDTSPELVNAADANGLRPLNHAARASQAEIVMTLSSRGADLNAGKPLIDACRVTDADLAADMVATLAGNNAHVNIKDDAGRTPLHYATGRGHTRARWLLIHRGALPNPGNIEVVFNEARFRGVDLSHGAGIPQMAINRFVGVSHGNTAAAKDLLAKHPEALNRPATFDELAIEAAAHMGNLEWCKELAELGSAYSLCTAVVLGDLAGVKQMIAGDQRRLRERGPHDQAVLCYTALGKPQLELAEYLLSQGVDIESRGLGQTTLHFAARRGHLELAKFLLEKGANVNAKSWSRFFPGTPLALAKQEAMIVFLKAHGASL